MLHPATTSLTGFSGETIWPLGQLKLLVKIGDADHSTKAWMDFIIIRSLSPYNGIIGRLGIREIQAVPSTAHGMLEFPVDGGIVTIRSTILIPAECATVTTSSKKILREAEVHHENLKVALHSNFPDQELADMTRVPRSVAEHWLNIREGHSPVRQKKRGHALEHAKAIQAEVHKLEKGEIIIEVYYHRPGLSNTSHGEKASTVAEEVRTDFHGLKKKPRPVQDYYPPSRNQHRSLNLSAATTLSVSWTLTKAITRYRCQVGRNIKVYVNDLVIKSHTKAEMLRDIDETFRTLRKINMKLNHKKCTFGTVEGTFLGYMISPEGIKPCPDKTEAVVQISSPQTIKEVQSLNRKLASLNRFLSKSAEKSLPLFKTLKKCIKKSDFHWTLKAKQAFKQLKQHLSELPLLVAPKPKEELIVYMSASHGAINAVLMTERGTVQKPVYFISRALQGPELNYTPMEKLVLALVFAAKRLRRYFQAYPIAVITDQPIKQIISQPDVAERLQKWSVMLREHNITYRPRTSVKGQILANFLVEKPDEAPPDTSVVEIPQESWILFTDGSSCVDGSGAGLIMTIPEGTEFTYALRFQFTASNNEAEYEALIVGLRIAAGGSGDSSRGRRPTWMTPIMEYLKDGTIPDDRKEAKKLRIKARQYELLEGVLYRWKGQVFYSRYGLFHEVDRGESRGENHRQLGEIVSDNGKQFSDNPFKDWCEKLNIIQRFTSIEELPHVLWAYRTMIKSSHGDTPFSLTYGTEAVIPAEIGMPTYRTAAVDAVHNNEELRLNLDLLEERRERAAIREAKAKLKMSKYYNARVRGVAFRPGDFVYRSNEASHAMDGGKLGPKWEGPYEVTEALGDGAYMLRSLEGTVLPRTWNIANLKKCYL
ncbi:reverse transcriptase domain-containing protein [Tanacetum coccineum]